MTQSNLNSREAFATHFATLQFDASLEAIGNDETIVPSSLRDFQGKVDAIQTLPRMSVRAPENATLNPDLDVLGTLGEGGMGLVRLAQQVPLKRNVAVKTLRGIQQRHAAQSLLKEAYVTGHLEHPNVVPIYTLGRDDEGAPLIVMKCIEGEVWLDEITAQHADGNLDLDRHIEILEHVCSAVRFAHSRGVIHRDIKPENVMIGAYEEVYLLDWGIAVSLDDSHPILPRRSDSVGVAGTPSYMAPEMTMDDASEVDEQTDVYMLGATLHHILTGQPRHASDSIFDAMFSAVKSEPFVFEDDVPTPLAEIANRACAREKKDRYESVTEFRQALQDWTQHRGSIEIAEEALRSLESLEAKIESDRSEEVELAIHDLAGECRFGFRQALRMWPQNDLALTGQSRFLTTLFDFYVQTKQPIPARATLGEIGADAPTPMKRELEALESEMAATRRKVDKLEQMADDLDLRTAATSRSRLAILLGILWAISNIYIAWVIHTGPPLSNAELIENNLMSSFRSLFIAGIGVFAFRKRVFANLANRRMIYMLFGMMAAMVIMRAIFWMRGTDYVSAHSAEAALFGFGIIAMGIVSDLRISALSLFFFVSAGLGVAFPEFQNILTIPFNLAVFLGLAWMWSPRQMDKRILMEQLSESSS